MQRISQELIWDTLVARAAISVAALAHLSPYGGSMGDKYLPRVFEGFERKCKRLGSRYSWMASPPSWSMLNFGAWRASDLGCGFLVGVVCIPRRCVGALCCNVFSNLRWWSAPLWVCRRFPRLRAHRAALHWSFPHIRSSKVILVQYQLPLRHCTDQRWQTKISCSCSHLLLYSFVWIDPREPNRRRDATSYRCIVWALVGQILEINPTYNVVQ